MENSEHPILEASPSGNKPTIETPKRKPLFPTGRVPEAYFVENPHTILGTRDNVRFIAGWEDDPDLKVYGSLIDRAIGAKEEYDRKVEDIYRTTGDRYLTKPAQSTGIGGDFAPQLSYGQRIELPDEVKPKLNPYAFWFTSKGRNRAEIISSIARDSERSSYIVDRMMQMGVVNLLNNNKATVESPDELSALLINNGYLNKEDEKFFKTDAKTPYEKFSAYWGTSPYLLLKSKLANINWRGVNHPSTLPEQISMGRRLNPDDENDVNDLDNYIKWKKTSDGTSWAENFITAGGQFVSDVAKSISRAVEAVGYPEFRWSKEWEDGKISSEKQAQKRRFVQLFNEWRERYERGELPESSLDKKIQQFEILRKENPELDPFEIIDPRKPSEIHSKLLADLTGAFNELKKDGAFDFDVRGLTSLLSLADGAVQGTLGMGMLMFSTDPDSFLTNQVTEQIANYYEMKKSLGINDDGFSISALLGGYLKGINHDPLVGVFSNPSVPDIDKKKLRTKAMMRYLNASADMHGMFEAWKQEGFILGESQLYDSKVGYHTSNWADVNLLESVGKKIFSLGERVAGKTAMGAAFLEKRLAESRRIATEQAEYMLRRFDSLPPEFGKVVDAVAADVEASTGVKLPPDKARADAIRRIYAGESLMPDPKNPSVKIPFTSSMLDGFSAEVADHASAMAAMRRKFASLVVEGRKIKYSKDAYETLSKFREHLSLLEPDGEWTKATDFEIYQRLKMGKLGEMTTELESRKAKLFSEVGNHWKKFDKADLAAWERFDANELSVGVTAPGQALVASVGYAAHWLNKGVDWLEERVAAMRKETKTIPGASDVRTALRVGNETVPGAAMNHVQTNNAYTKISFAQQIFAVLGSLGYVDFASELAVDWMNKYRKLGTEAAERFSTFQNLIEDYSKELDDLYAQQKRDSLLVGTAKTKKEADAIAEKISRLEAKKKMAHLMGSLSTYGMASGVAHIGSGIWSAGSNELLMYLSDTRMLGSATAYSFGGKGINFINRSWMRNMSPTYGVKERANMDLVEIGGKLADKSDSQKMHILELLVSLAKNRDEVLNRPGSILMFGEHDQAHLNYARGVSLINRAMSSADSFEVQPSGFIDGLGTILSSREFANNPEHQAVMMKIFSRQAEEKGLRGEEAEAFAKQMLDRHEQSTSISMRLNVLEKEKSKLLANRQKLAETYSGILTEIEEKAKAVALENGVEIGVAGDLMQNEKLFQNIKIKGIPLSAYSPEVARKYIKAISVFQGAAKEIVDRKLDIERQINDINSELFHQDQERADLTRKQSENPIVTGDYIVSDKQGNVITKRGAVTIWETPYVDEDGVLRTRTKIILNKDTFLQRADYRNQQQGGMQRLYEEISHSLLFTERFQQHRVMFTRALFGNWSINEHNELVQTEKPFITGDLEKNLKLLDLFTETYAQGLPENERDSYLARYRYGREMLKKNPADWHYLRDSITELYGQVYVQRMMLSHPQNVKTSFSGSTYNAGWETSPIVAGSSKWKLGLKMLFGQVTPMDIVIQSRGEQNLKGLFEIDPDTTDPQQRKILEAFESDVKSANLFLSFFGMGGISDQAMQNGFVKKALDLGLRKNNNDSPDPMKFWINGMIWDDVTGRPVPIDPSLTTPVDVAQASTRGVKSQTSLMDPYNIALIEREQDSDAPDAIQRRVFWAYATGRKSWLKVGNKFKDKVKMLFVKENESMEEFKNFVIENDPDGTITGLDIVTNSDGSKSVFGSPNRGQTIRIINWFKKANERAGTWSADPKERVFSQNTLTVITNFLEGIAQSNIFDSDNVAAGTAGKIPVYLVSYQGVTTGEGPGTTAQKSLLYYDQDTKRYVPAGPRQRRIAPWAFTIEPSQIDGDGNVLEATDEFGRVKPGERGTMNVPYFWVMDIDALDERMRAGWEGKLIDKNGKTYPITSQEFQAFFDKDYNTYVKALNTVLSNFSMHAGSPQKGSKQYGVPPKRTWQALLPFVTDKNGNANQAKAMQLADVLLRVIGFPDDNYSEFKALDVKQERTRLSASERARYEELKDKLMNASVDEKKRIFAQIGAKHRNELGAGPMWDTRMIFMKVRAERFVGIPMALTDKNGAVSMINFTPWSYPWGKANYAGINDWNLIPHKEVDDFASKFNMQGNTLRAGYSHPSGYSMFLVDTATTANPAGTRKWLVFDTNKAVVPGEFSTARDAATAAENHSKANPVAGAAEVGNKWEMQMQSEGWIPVGTSFGVHGFRTEWLSPDGAWRIKGNSAVGNWELYDTKHNLLVSSGIKLRAKDDPSNINIGELNSQVKFAIDTNKVQQLVTQERHRVLTESGIIEWVRKKDPFSGKQTETVFADNNKVYWAFKSHLVKVFGAAIADAVTEKMKKDLTPQVIESGDPRETAKWIQNYRQEAVDKGLFGFLFNSPDATLSADRAHRLARRPVFDRARDNQPPAKSEERPGWNPDLNTVESYRILQQKWHEANEAFLQSTAFTDAAENRQLQEQAHNTNVSNFNAWVDSLKRDMEEWKQQNTTREPGTPFLNAQAQQGQTVINSMYDYINQMRQAGHAVETTSYVNDYGNIILELTYKSEGDILGTKVKIPSVFGGKFRGSEFFVFNPSGAFVSKEDTLEKAQIKALDSLEPVLNYKKKTILEAIKKSDQQEAEDLKKKRQAILDAGGVNFEAAPSRASKIARYERK